MIILTPRQVRIFLDFYNNSEEYISLSFLADKYNLTTRTIQSDIAEIRETAQSYGIDIIAYPGKGIKLTYESSELFEQFYQLTTRKLNSSSEFSDQNSRVKFLINYLINQNTYVKSSDLADLLFISRSRLSSDLKLVRKHFEKYDLEIISKPSHGIMVSGDEANKRFCLIKESIYAHPIINLDNSESLHTQSVDINLIGDIVTDAFFRNKYKISEIVLQNLIVHVYVAITRIRNKHRLDDEEMSTIQSNYYHVHKIAEEIMVECSKRFSLPVLQAEIDYLAINIYGKKEFDDEDYITSQINDMIFGALENLNTIYNMDFTNELDLRISLGLHLTPLLIRVKNNMQFDNLSLLNIKQIYPLAYNIATDFISYIFPGNNHITEDEISYIAVHFITYAEREITSQSKNNILIICPYRLSDTFLMRQKILRDISSVKQIDVVSESSFEFDDLDRYTVVITTEKHIAEKYPEIRLVNYFIDNFDIKKIDFALRGLTHLEDILSKFDKKLFYKGPGKSKKAITDTLITLVSDALQLDDSFAKSVLNHEEKTPSSFFGNGIAILHPEEPITETSFIAVAIPDNSIQWDYESRANIVLLMSIEKNNPKAFRLWSLLAELITNEEFVNSHSTVKNYEDLEVIVNSIYSKLF
ncbi:MAG: transcription antiterminator [Erysipelothrix sp.]|nr:transcription antiterminator [Erysipelothrix sp.]